MSGKRLKPRAHTKAAALVQQAIVELATGTQTAINSLFIARAVGSTAAESWLKNCRICHGRRVGHIPEPTQPKHPTITRRDRLDAETPCRIIP